MAPLDCELFVWSHIGHVQQIYTGLTLLHRQGLIRLRQWFQPMPEPDPHVPSYLRGTRAAHCAVVIEDHLRLYYDLHDSGHIDSEEADRADRYFKRSYDPATTATRSLGAKVLPLGLNYEVHPDGHDALSIERSRAAGQGVGALLRRLAANLAGRARRPTMASTSGSPSFGQPSRALFMTHAWDPRDHQVHSAIEAEERLAINAMRERCILALRQELGPHFLGGFARTPFALQNHPDGVLQDGVATRKGSYLRILRQYPICVTTMGLHGSNGWKLAEYVAQSRAIVVEKLRHTVPGGFAQNTNYLHFDDERGCVEAVVRLMTDDGMRHAMMLRNHLYYLSWLRPDLMVLRSFERALEAPRTAVLP